ncbi:hypothetical protein HN018_04090 [Lichenicola cladoniae]|uniref:PRC-barrel domain-containing protein n=1 Tax=Lichenicola cladoniae TaxID=1484109 RepID=A0A6M8HLV5_9PROT|nr:hypothetical protein [Lichenicola cladoniae]NPD69898.1 hypothetical protein [Acetobacteraceae bacterium]QKE89320.1 hypothetical protein HN018_04090 [Lichenicola cladoniae]
MMRLAILLPALLLNASALAQSHTPGGMPPPPGMSLTQSTAMRFPQPVQVGSLLHRLVLRPVESQTVLGRVVQVVRDEDGTIELVVAYGGFLGIGSRPIAVPIDATVLLGTVMEIVAYTPEQLRRLPTFTGTGTTPLPADTVLRIGLAKPSH